MSERCFYATNISDLKKQIKMSGARDPRLVEAARAGDEEAVLAMLKTGVQVNNKVHLFCTIQKNIVILLYKD